MPIFHKIYEINANTIPTKSILHTIDIFCILESIYSAKIEYQRRTYDQITVPNRQLS